MGKEKVLEGQKTGIDGEGAFRLGWPGKLLGSRLGFLILHFASPPPGRDLR